jgi:hypothetical protein
MDTLEKNIYNTYLATSGKYQNRPFKYRKNWDDFESTEKYIYVQKLANILRKFPQIDLNVFFKAPYEVYGKDQHFNLQFYSTQKAINCYSKYKKKLDMSIDSDETIENIKKQVVFIGTFCQEHKISLNEYLNFSEFSIYSFIKHLKEGNISIYVLFYFDLALIEKKLFSFTEEEREIILSNIIENLSLYYSLYMQSNRMKKIVVGAMEIIKKELEISQK